MRDLIHEPICRSEDLGSAIPESVHAVSVALPLWEHVVGYEEKEPAVVDKMNCGYPRFFCHPYLRELFALAKQRFGRQDNEKAMVLLSRGAAERCLIYLRQHSGIEARAEDLGLNGLWAVLFPADVEDLALKFWQHCGEIPSSRFTAAVLEKPNADSPGRDAGEAARSKIRGRLADESGQRPEDVYLFPSGMAGVVTVHRAIGRLYPGRKSVQLEFPYVDVLKVQKLFGPGVHFLPLDESGDLGPLETLLEQTKVSGVYCELASNPLLRTVDIQRAREILSRHEVPLIADDTIGTVFNIDAFQAADVVTSSLTKYFSGVGDVLAGSVILRADSPFYERFKGQMEALMEGTLWDGDAIVLERNSRDYRERMRGINRGGEALFDYLEAHPKVDQIWFPKNRTREFYDRIKRPEGGYSSLISILLRDAPEATPRFYDALRVSKGPSLGTNYSLACPYTLLAHYRELDWAEECGVSRHLIRISAGLEDPHDLIARFDEALARV